MSSSPLDTAVAYIRRGWAPVPVPYRKKRPVLEGWQKLRITEADAPQYFNGARMNVGILLGEPSRNLVDVDLDCAEVVKLAPYFLPPTETIFGRDGKPKSHWLYRADLKTAKFVHPENKEMLVEVRSTGGQTVFPGSVHPSGEEIDWSDDGDPAEVHPASLLKRTRELAAAALLAGHWPSEHGRHDGQLTVIAYLTRAGWTVDAIAHFVARVSWAAGADRDYEKRKATAEDAARRLAAGEELRGWTSFEELFGEKVARAAAKWLGVKTKAAPAADADGFGGLTEDQLAVDFTARHGDELRYVAIWNQWLRWTGARWEREPTLRAFDLARVVCREASAGLENNKLRATIASAKTVNAVVTLARADRKHAAVVEQWDADPWRLNTPHGVIDLRAGKLHRHDRAEHHTKITAAAPERADCPLWRTFLARVTDGDEDLQAFLQRMAGYTLTGSIREHALFFLYGTGGNGKGVFLNTLTGILGDYATVASMETFTASQSDRHPTDLAMLRGARLVTAQETEEGRRWAESRIKAMTGGDPITARFMRADFFTYEPQFKLLIAGNHKPGLRNVDEAIRRRFHLIPFTVKIPPRERDLELPDKLKAEWPAILAWMIHGCLAWQRHGLNPPPSVQAATEEYFGAEDALQTWIEDCCVRHPNAVTTSAELFDSWRAWAEPAGEFVGSRKRFAQCLEDRGFVACKDHLSRRAFRGLGIKSTIAGGAP